MAAKTLCPTGTECDSSHTCIDGVCKRNCTSDSECMAIQGRERICINGYCDFTDPYQRF